MSSLHVSISLAGDQYVQKERYSWTLPVAKLYLFSEPSFCPGVSTL